MVATWGGLRAHLPNERKSYEWYSEMRFGPDTRQRLVKSHYNSPFPLWLVASNLANDGICRTKKNESGHLKNISIQFWLLADQRRQASILKKLLFK